MSGPNFYPMPTPPRRGIVRWLFFAFHLLFFGCGLLSYSQMEGSITDIELNNLLQLGLLFWAILLGVNLLLAALLELRETFARSRLEGRRRREFEMHRRKRTIEAMNERARSGTR